jgi:hypothetical protein
MCGGGGDLVTLSASHFTTAQNVVVQTTHKSACNTRAKYSVQITRSRRRQKKRVAKFHVWRKIYILLLLLQVYAMDPQSSWHNS